MAAEDASLVIIGGGIAFLKAVKDAAKSKRKVTAVCGNPFLEWPMAATIFLTQPEVHDKWLCANTEDFKEKGVEYIFDSVTEILPQEKRIRFSNNPEISYSAVVIATGHKMPLILPVPGESLQARKAEVQKAGAAVKAAKTIVVNGAGLVGLELAGDAKLANPGARVILLSRSGQLLSGSHPEDWQQRVSAKARDLGIEVMKGTVSDPECASYKLAPGKLPLSNSAQESLDSDVYMPAYGQGPNTAFLAKSRGVLNERNEIVVNEFLQSTAHPEIFAAGVSTVHPKHPISQGVTDQAAHAVAGALEFVDGKPPLKAFKNAGLERSMNVVVAHGKGGYLFWDTELLPCPAQCCCCLWCGGGFPFCPPPCCWCCGPGCSTTCGTCCSGSGHSEGAAIVHASMMLPKFAEARGYAGMGKAPAQQQMK